VVAELLPAAAEQPGIVIADATNSDALHVMASHTQVLLNLVGPYAQTGEGVVQVCIANGTHYIDLTGEPFWVQQLIARAATARRERRDGGIAVVQPQRGGRAAEIRASALRKLIDWPTRSRRPFLPQHPDQKAAQPQRSNGEPRCRRGPEALCTLQR